jgi:hypothetical protein
MNIRGIVRIRNLLPSPIHIEVQGGCLPPARGRIDAAAAEGQALTKCGEPVDQPESVAVPNRAVAMILEAVDPALWIFLNVRALDGIAVLVGVLLALAVTRAVVRRVVRVVDAVRSGCGFVMAGIAGRRKFSALGEQAVRADLLQRREVVRANASGAEEDEHERDRNAWSHGRICSKALSSANADWIWQT